MSEELEHDYDDIIDFRKIPNNTQKHWWLDPGIATVEHAPLRRAVWDIVLQWLLLNGLQSIDRWQEYFEHPSSNILGLMNSAGFLPGIIASLFSDRVAFHFGRRSSVWLGSAITTVGALVMGLATDTGMFCGGRVLLGFGTSTALTVAPSLLQEVAHPRLRAQMSAFYTTVYYIAAVLSAATCLGCIDLSGEKAWRIPCFVQLIGPVLTLLITATMPESPRWLAKKNKRDEARRILVKYHANGDDDDALVVYEMKQIEQALEFENQNKQIQYSDLVKSKANIHRLAISLVVAVGTNWVGNGIVSYYLSPILSSLGVGDPRTQLKILIGLQTWNLLVATTASLLVERAGRRPLWLSSTAGMLISFSIIMGLTAGYTETKSLNLGLAAIPFLFLFYGSYSIAWTPLAYSYPVEIFPYSLRTKAQAIYIMAQTGAVSVNTWVNPVALDALAWEIVSPQLHYAVYIAIQLVLLILIWFFFPETKGRTIEEISALFDEDASPLHHPQHTPTDNEAASVFEDPSATKD
ncbi:hexose transporter protein [Aspergillus venezuelensis]